MSFPHIRHKRPLQKKKIRHAQKRSNDIQPVCLLHINRLNIFIDIPVRSNKPRPPHLVMPNKYYVVLTKI